MSVKIGCKSSGADYRNTETGGFAWHFDYDVTYHPPVGAFVFSTSSASTDGTFKGTVSDTNNYSRILLHLAAAQTPRDASSSDLCHGTIHYVRSRY